MDTGITRISSQHPVAETPLKALVWQDADGHTQIAYNDPQYIIGRHGLDPALAANLAAVVPLIERAASD